MKKILLLVWVLSLSFTMMAQKDSTKVKKGLSVGPLPVVAFDSDLGFQYGALVNLYFYGDGSTYPQYKHLVFAEAAYSTKGSGIFRLFYDSDQILKNKDKYLRLSVDLSYLLESGLGFYGFNGFETNYNTAFETTDDDDYITRMYYRHQRKLFRAQVDVQGRIIGKKLRWVAGAAYMNFDISTVDVDRLNDGKKEDLLPDTITLYDDYVNYGLIGEDEANGGGLTMLKAGLVWDTRDLEANPNKGLWDEIVLYTFPGFLGNSENSFTGFTIIHRQYFTLYPKRLTFAYRLGYKGVIAGNMPFYFDPYMVTSYSLTANRGGLGGASTFRGMNRNRVVGDGFGWGNLCLRYKFWYFNFLGNPSYLALNAFMDMGQVFQARAIDPAIKAQMEKDHPGRYFTDKTFDSMHYSLGGGIHFAMNENFVVRVNYGRVLDSQDGTSSIYITTNWIF
jgi:outer membrane protein assembly factor BamA